MSRSYELVKKYNGVELYNVDGKLMTTTENIANNFDKNKSDVDKALKSFPDFNTRLNSAKLLNCRISAFGSIKPIKTTYIDRDTMTLLIMGFTGKKAFEWKNKYIEAFNLMEDKIKNGVFIPNEALEEIKSFMPKGLFGELNEKTGLAKTKKVRAYYRTDKHDELSVLLGKRKRLENLLNNCLFPAEIESEIDVVERTIKDVRLQIKNEKTK